MVKPESAALAIVQDFNLPALGDMGAAMQEEMEGLPTTFDRVKIPSGGGLAFEVPGDDPENPDTVKEIIGIIVDHHPVNAFWGEKYAGQNNPPDCSALDGKVGLTLDGQQLPCNSCPHNAWGSAEDGRGKACKNMHRLYILRDGDFLPLLLTLPPTSIKNFADYIAKRVLAKRRRSYDVITKVTLKKAVSGGGITYSQAVFSLAGMLHQDIAKKMAEYSAGIKAVTRNIEVAGDEYGSSSDSYGADVEVM
jgi:hypothetical protein